MSRLIDADDRIEFIKNAYCPECDNYNGVRCRACPINDMIEAIDDAPTVDLWKYPSRGEMPKDNFSYVLVAKDNEVFYGAYVDPLEQWVIYPLNGMQTRYYASKVDAWMPLPPPPKEEA